MKKRLLSCFCLVACISGFFCFAQDDEKSEKSAKAPGNKIAVYCPWDFGGMVLQDMFITRKLNEKYGIMLGDANFAKIAEPSTLMQFNVLVLFEFSRSNPDAKSVNSIEATPEALDKITDSIIKYVEEGGGLYIYGVSFTHMGDKWSNESLNKHLLKKLGAQVLFEELHDPDFEKKQEGGAGVTYFYTDRIEQHPATKGVKALWCPAGFFSYGMWTRPLLLGKEWKPLITTSEKFTSIPWLNDCGEKKGDKTQVPDKKAVIYAYRELGKGRIILNGGDSTIEFFNYGYSDFADSHWGRIYMEKGLDGKKSNGMKLFASSLRWLGEPTTGRNDIMFGGYTPPRAVEKKPMEPEAIIWGQPQKSGYYPYQKGVIGIIPAEAGGKGKISEYVAKAKTMGLNYAVFCGEFSKISKKDWDKLCDECGKNSSAEFSAMPALLTNDDQGNSFIQCTKKSWPDEKYLSKKDPKRVQEHLGYWMIQCNFPARGIFNINKGQYPAELNSGYDTFAVRTYENGKLVEEQLNGFLNNQMQGDRSRIIVMDMIRTPADLGKSKEFTFVYGGNPVAAYDTFVQPQFGGGNISYVSSGPEIIYWGAVNSGRNTYGVEYVPGTERWRASLKVKSAVPLKLVTVYDCETVFRKFAVSGNEIDISFDGLHDTRHVLTAVIEDEKGGKAVTGGLEILDYMMIQYFCSDRCNIMSGGMTVRDKKGFHKTEPATCMLYKAGRLSAYTTAPGESLPGIDGSGTGVQFNLSVTFVMNAEGDMSEARAPLHAITRPYENANCIIFDTPISRRSPAAASDIFGHAPYVDVAVPDKVDFGLTQYSYYRNPGVPTAMVAEFTMKAKKDGIQLKNGWNNFSVQMAGAWGNYKKYAIVRADGTAEEGPSADETTSTNWRGTLMPGDSFLLPEIGEGFFVLDGEKIDMVVECVPSKKWFRIFTGRFDVPKLEKGKLFCQKVTMVKIIADSAKPVESWLAYGEKYGLTGKAPAYSVKAKQGKILSFKLPLEIEADKNGFAGTFDKAVLPQRLCVTVKGLNPKWTAGMIDQTRNSWIPLGVWNSSTYLTIDTNDESRNVYIGNIVKTDNPDLLLVLLPNEEGGGTVLDVHNPTAKKINAEVSVLVSSFLAKEQKAKVEVAPLSTQRINLEK